MRCIINRQHSILLIGQRWYIFFPAVVICICGLIPLVYLIAKAFQLESSTLVENLLRWRNVRLFFNTVLLTIGVLLTDILLATPAAWLTSRSDIKHKRTFSVLCTLPLAIPGYVIAYALLALGGYNGIFAWFFGWNIPRLNGYWGALIALSFYTTPYLFLNLRTALLGLDPSVEESARSLGYGQWRVFIHVILPQLRPAFYAAGLLICLHVLGDFGVVSLMRYETFSYALYVEYRLLFEHNYAAWLALILLTITGCLLFLEGRMLYKVDLHKAGHGTSRIPSIIPLQRLKYVGYTYLCVLFIATVCIPTLTVILWLFRGFEVSTLEGIIEAFLGSISISIPVAIGCALMAVPFAYINVRYSTRFSNAIARIPYIVYAIPPLAFGLAIIFFVRRTDVTVLVLIIACMLHFLAEAIGPVRSPLYQASPHLEEVARSLGCSPIMAFLRTLLPLLFRGMLIAIALVFLATMKELPLTLLLRPPEYETLAVNVWDYTEEAMFAQAAPYAFIILLTSAIFVGLLIRKER